MSARPVSQTQPGGVPGVQVFPGVVILTGTALDDANYLFAAGLREAAKNGYPTGRLEQMREAIKQAGVARARQRASVMGVDCAYCGRDDEVAADTISTRDAAALLGMPLRSCQRLAKQGLGRKVGGRYVLDRDLVIAEAQARQTRTERTE